MSSHVAKTPPHRLLVLGDGDPLRNLVVEEAVLNLHARGLCPPTIITWRSSPAVVLGSSSKASQEVALDEAKRLRIGVVRRISGGGAVYQDMGNLNFCVVTSTPYLGHPVHNITRNYDFFCSALAVCLGDLGLACTTIDPGSLLVSGAKVSGAAQKISGNALLYHFTLLVDADLEIMGRVLRQMKYPTANLSDLLGSLEIKGAQASVLRGLEEKLAAIIVGGEVSPSEGRAADHLFLKKSNSAEWRIL